LHDRDGNLAEKRFQRLKTEGILRKKLRKQSIIPFSFCENSDNGFADKAYRDKEKRNRTIIP
jgi:hypothetical protein